MLVATGPLLLLLVLPFALPAQETAPAAKPEPSADAAYIRAHYTKYEHRIPMRDGKRLFTAVYLPKDRSQPYPFLLVRTPYGVGPYGADQYRERFGRSRRFLEEGFIFVFQDVRGRYMSEGEFVNVRPYLADKRGPQDADEASDCYDTIDWLVKHIPNHNGRAGVAGISYPGFYAAMCAIDAHPALKAASPQAPVTDWFLGDDFHHNGGFYLPHFFRFFTSFGLPRPEPTTQAATPIAPSFPNAYEFFLNVGPLVNLNEKYFKNQIGYWSEFIQHPNYDDYWKARDLRVGAPRMKPAMLTVGGWYDAEDLFGALKLYEAIEQRGKPAQNLLVMGPWYHGQWGNDAGEALGKVKFHAKTGEFYREQIEFPFFLHHLKEKGDPHLPKAYLFETGTNQWRRFPAWPPPAAQKKTLYLHPEGKLAFTPPVEAAAAPYEEYISDPAKPVPFTPEIVTSMTRTHMVDDQRFAGMRPDVLVFQTEPLEEDVLVAGPLTPSLYVSTSGTDSDWVVKLIDVYPDDYPEMGGYQQLVRGELFRGRFRNSYERPEPFVSNKVERVRFQMPDVLHNFRRGHRILVHIQSTWFPLVDRNPQKFVPNIFEARKEDFIRATQRVYRTPAQPSGIEILTLPAP